MYSIKHYIWFKVFTISSVKYINSIYFICMLLLLLLLSHFSQVRLCATPETAAHQAPPSLGFSRQEHWSGLPFPSPIHESEKWKWSRSVMSDPQRPHGLQPSRLLCPWDIPGKSTGVGCHCLLQAHNKNLINICWINEYVHTRCACLMNSAGQNTEVGSLSLLQGIVPIQGSKPCLRHCRCIFYQLSHKGSPRYQSG